MANPALGLLCAFIAVFFFGSNFLPVKAFDTGDGMFFQWVLCTGIWTVGLIINIVSPYSDDHRPPQFFPLAMLGGFIWATGNLTVVPIIQTIGLAKGLVIWGSVGMLAGWLSGAFGILGVKSQASLISNWPLNIGGVALALCSLVVSSMLKPDMTQKPAGDGSSGNSVESASAHYTPIADPTISMLTRTNSEETHNEAAGTRSGKTSWIDDLSESSRSMVGVTLSLAGGCFYGTNFNPPQYIIDRFNTTVDTPGDNTLLFPGATPHGLDYVFAHFSGIFLSSTMYFLAYAAYMGNRPVVLPRVVLPGFLSGVMWGVAQCCWFIANDNLGFIEAFPIICSGPGMVASLWSVFYLGELSGKRNYGLLMIIFVLVVASALMITLSHKH